MIILLSRKNKFKGEFERLGENTEKYSFQFQIKKKSEKLIKMVMRILQLLLTK